MLKHLNNIEKLLCHTVEEVSSEKLIDILYGKINQLIESQIIQRDIENLISYFKFVLSAAVIPKELTLDVKLVRYFVSRTYAGFDRESKEQRVRKIFYYLKNNIGEGAEINKRTLATLKKVLGQEAKPSFEKLKERVLVGTILKWLQGPLKEQLSAKLNDYVIFLATSFGQYETERILNVEKITHKLSEKDRSALVSAYAAFEIAVLEAVKAIRDARPALSESSSAQEQFRVVFDSIDNLVKKSEAGELQDMAAFKDKLIVSTTLIYLQDDLVKKDEEVKKLIQLFVALYYQFRDKRVKPKTEPKS